MSSTNVAVGLARAGFVFIPAIEMSSMLGNLEPGAWDDFASSWNDLPSDTHMGDGGRYRRRRFACFTMHDDRICREPHQPHYQSVDYNALNGGVERWFGPVTDAIADHVITRRLLELGHGMFSRAAGARPECSRWHVEMHQFRIEANRSQAGLPTPEGMHRDGVDWVIVTLIARVNVDGGVTAVQSAAREDLGSFTLGTPLDTVFLDDHRVWHGVTPVVPSAAAGLAHRDVLVLTFRSTSAA